MKYPTSITIKGYTYKIEYVSTPQEVDTDFENRFWLGQCNNDTIRIWASQEPFGILDTLAHEILHAIFNRNKMLKAALQSEEMEEPFIDTLATELASLLALNGWATPPAKSPPITKRITQETK